MGFFKNAGTEFAHMELVILLLIGSISGCSAPSKSAGRSEMGSPNVDSELNAGGVRSNDPGTGDPRPDDYARGEGPAPITGMNVTEVCTAVKGPRDCVVRVIVSEEKSPGIRILDVGGTKDGVGKVLASNRQWVQRFTTEKDNEVNPRIEIAFKDSTNITRTISKAIDFVPVPKFYFAANQEYFTDVARIKRHILEFDPAKGVVTDLSSADTFNRDIAAMGAGFLFRSKLNGAETFQIVHQDRRDGVTSLYGSSWSQSSGWNEPQVIAGTQNPSSFFADRVGASNRLILGNIGFTNGPGDVSFKIQSMNYDFTDIRPEATFSPRDGSYYDAYTVTGLSSPTEQEFAANLAYHSSSFNYPNYAASWRRASTQLGSAFSLEYEYPTSYVLATSGFMASGGVTTVGGESYFLGVKSIALPPLKTRTTLALLRESKGKPAVQLDTISFDGFSNQYPRLVADWTGTKLFVVGFLKEPFFPGSSAVMVIPVSNGHFGTPESAGDVAPPGTSGTTTIAVGTDSINRLVILSVAPVAAADGSMTYTKFSFVFRSPSTGSYESSNTVLPLRFTAISQNFVSDQLGMQAADNRTRESLD